MKTIRFAIFAVLTGLATVSCEKAVIDDNVYHVLDANGHLTQKNTYHLGTDISNPTEFYYIDYIEMQPFILSHSIFKDSRDFGEGFTYTNCKNDTTPGYTNLSAITANGVAGDSYFIANAGGFDTPAQITFQNGMACNAIECYVTNSTYAFLTIRDSNDNSGIVQRKWSENDWFKLTITGYNGDTETGHVEFLLADGRKIVNTWQKVDLTGLGRVTRLLFTLSSTDTSEYGGVTYMNTPSYFCLDQLKVSE